MTKDALIAHLQTIPGNPEIVIWSDKGRVYFPIDKPVTQELFKNQHDELVDVETEESAGEFIIINLF